jgi:2-oxoglutarate ferredoxin oxidoreductase subunit gamma
VGQKLPIKGEVIITGLGGSGVLTVGILLAKAAMTKYKNVTWFPSYAISKRGGLCECTVVFSDDEIASPLLSQASGIIVAEAAQFRNFEGRLRPGGIMIVEKARRQAKAQRKDIRIIEVPAVAMAISLSGTSEGATLVLLGAFVEVAQTIPPEFIKVEIKKAFADNERMEKNNLQAFEKGRSLIRGE